MEVLVEFHVLWILKAAPHAFLCLTSKMSETDTWRRACASTNCDKYPASLHRFVRLIFHFLSHHIRPREK
jgi:hypothetical protein